MKIIFIGAVQFSLQMLETLIEQNAEVVGVITDHNRGVNADYADLKPLCDLHGLEVLLTKDVNSSATIDWVEKLSPDVIFCCGWSRLIKQDLLCLPPMGVIGYHPAELPKNRGRHPLVWALVLGLESTASTFFFMDEGADSGDILSQQPIKILKDDTAGDLYEKMIHVAKIQVVEMLPLLITGTYNRLPQDCNKANMWRKRGEKDGEIDWRMSAYSIHNLVRGLAKPYIGAHISMNGKAYKLWKTRKNICNDVGNIEPGKVLSISSNGYPIIKCGDGCIELLEVEPTLNLKTGMYL